MKKSKKDKDNKLLSWIITGTFWLIGIVCLFWGGIKHINNTFGTILVIALVIPLLVSLLLTFNVKVPFLICNTITVIFYFVFVICSGLAYKIQDYAGYVLPGLLFIFFAILAFFYALYKTLRNSSEA